MYQATSKKIVSAKMISLTKMIAFIIIPWNVTWILRIEYLFIHHLYIDVCLTEKFVMPLGVLASRLMVCSPRISIAGYQLLSHYCWVSSLRLHRYAFTDILYFLDKVPPYSSIFSCDMLHNVRSCVYWKKVPWNKSFIRL